MRCWLSILVVGSAITTVVGAQRSAQTPPLPTVDQILEKYVEALGGRAASEKITSRITRSSVETADGDVLGTSEEIRKAPDKMLVSMDIGMGAGRQAVDGDSGWVEQPGAGRRPMTAPELANSRLTLFIRDLRLKSLYKTMTVRGRESVGGRDLFVIDAVPVLGGPERMYFDAAGGLLVRMDRSRDSGAGTVNIEIHLEDYRDVDGVKLPFRLRQVFPAGTRIIRTTDVKHNVPIDDAVFRGGRQGGAGPLAADSICGGDGVAGGGRHTAGHSQ